MKSVVTMYDIDTCPRNNLCVDCNNMDCLHCGKLHSDCPKFFCDNDMLHDCEHCDFIQKYIAEHRKPKLKGVENE